MNLQFSNSNDPLTARQKTAKIKQAAKHFGKFMNSLGFDWENDPNSTDTPMRVAKAVVNDVCSGCFDSPPAIRAFANTNRYDGIVAQCNIQVVSLCAHHWMPFTGVAHIGYIPSPDGKIIGLSKLNRIVEWFARRPTVQEDMTSQISEYVNQVCEGNNGVAVVIEANHTCCSNRGVKHKSTMKTARMTGAFLDEGPSRQEFYDFVRDLK